MVDEAARQHSQGHFANAANLLIEILKIDPEHTGAAHGLGFMYSKGQGVEQDYSKARELYEQAHKVGNVRSTTNLACMYENGIGMAQDYVKAKELYMQAHDGGNALATNNLGYMHLMGHGVEQDFTMAATLFEQSHKAGTQHATANLGYMYENGLGVVQDVRRAKELYESVPEMALAKASLRVMYERGVGEHDPNTAQKSSESMPQDGNTYAPRFLAEATSSQCRLHA